MFIVGSLRTPQVLSRPGAPPRYFPPTAPIFGDRAVSPTDFRGVGLGTVEGPSWGTGIFVGVLIVGILGGAFWLFKPRRRMSSEYFRRARESAA